MFRRAVAGLRRDLAAAPLDLPLLAWIQAAGIVLAALIAKWLAISGAYGAAPISERLGALSRVIHGDLQLGALLLLLALLARFLPSPGPRPRALLFGLLQVAAIALLLMWFANVEFFSSWGTPLSLELVSLTPHIAAYILGVGVSNQAGAMTAFLLLAIVLVVGSSSIAAAARSRLVADGRWRQPAWALPALLVVAAFASGARDRLDYREEMLARLHPLGIFTDLSGLVPSPGHPASAEDQQRLAAVLGPTTTTAADALAPLSGRRPNVLVWSLESVGARYMRSFHPLGRARTPVLDAATARGSVTFDAAYCESPLSAQTTWALITGMSPPAKPFLFVYGDLPPHGPTLPGELQRAGYRTGLFSSSYHTMWATERIFNLEPFEVFEDANDYGLTAAYAQNGTGVEDRAMLDGLERWLDSGGRDKRFFSVLWNVETHKPFTWAGMPDELKQARDEDRYVATIERADALLGRVLAALEARSLLQDTLVVVMGDHGEGLGRAPRAWDVSHSGQVYEDGVHVPLTLLHPALGVHRTDALVTHADLMPTLLEIAGRPVPPGLDGRSLLRPLEAAPMRMRSIIWWPMAARAGRYKLLLTSPVASPQLFDLVDDPREATDLSKVEPGLTRALHADLLTWHTQRFRSDPSFGYRFPPLWRIIAQRSRVESFEWMKVPPPEPTPAGSPGPAAPGVQ